MSTKSLRLDKHGDVSLKLPLREQRKSVSWEELSSVKQTYTQSIVLWLQCLESHRKKLNPNYGNNYHNSEPYWQLLAGQNLSLLYGSRGLAHMDPDHASWGRKNIVHTPGIGTGMEMRKRKSRVWGELGQSLDTAGAVWAEAVFKLNLKRKNQGTEISCTVRSWEYRALSHSFTIAASGTNSQIFAESCCPTGFRSKTNLTLDSALEV